MMNMKLIAVVTPPSIYQVEICRLFKIMVSLSRMYFPVASVSYLRVNIPVVLLSNACLY